MKQPLLLAGLTTGTFTALAMRFQSIERPDFQRVRLAWESRAGETYALERAPELLRNFAGCATRCRGPQSVVGPRPSFTQGELMALANGHAAHC